LYHELKIVLDFGAQYISYARRVRETNVYCEVCLKMLLLRNKIIKSKGIIFQEACTVLDEGAPFCTRKYTIWSTYSSICYCMQLMSVMLGGSVEKSSTKGIRKNDITLNTEGKLLGNR
jgi:GMP synthase (glutamine-hydrolysing)